ncbi:Hybrid signal transduction histidine kinase B [Penicillium rolfsii]|nr:Hybrid signal transduction histidine kinase B [Penicillium rolfsii]
MAATGSLNLQPRYRLAQEREFYKYVPHEHAASPYAPFDHASHNTFIPHPSPDSTLTSFAQLGAIRLGTQRALVSLFDRTHQHILAEGTPTISLTGGHFQDDRERLKLGCCVLPKERGFCHLLEGLLLGDHKKESSFFDDRTLVVLDVTKDERVKSDSLLDELSDIRFYAAAPIVSPRGFTIGAYCVMDSEPRKSGPDQHALRFMKDMAGTVMDHLVKAHSTRKRREAERMVVGLGSFFEGRTTLRDSWREANTQFAESERSGEAIEGQFNIQQPLLEVAAGEAEEHQGLVFRDKTQGAGEKHELHPSKSYAQVESQGGELRTKPTQHDHNFRSRHARDTLQDNTLSNSIKSVFSRAANLIRESIEAEGVMFLDANSERFGSQVKHSSRKVSGSSSDDTASSGDEGTSSVSRNEDHTDNSLLSECLGFSSSNVSSINDESMAGRAVTIPEQLLTSLLRRYPNGKIFTYNAHGSVSEDSEDSSLSIPESNYSPLHGYNRTERKKSDAKKRNKPIFQQDADHLIKLFPGARNILLLPIWDSDKSRWFAGTLVWTNDPERVFSFENELVYVAAFANSIMAEIRRLDVEIADKAKTNLVSSITHELRNPLHGILGTADILSDTAMNALQHGMVHTIESCGRTLLDTINNLLDLTFIDKYQKKRFRQNGKPGEKLSDLPSGSAEAGRVQGKDSGEQTSNTSVKLDAVLEEVTECVFAGHSFYTHPQVPPPALTDSYSRWSGPSNTSDQVGPRASQVTVIFDIQSDTEWKFYTHAGAWRRILMNVFGNALKYTKSGYIYLQLKSSQSDKKGDQVTPVGEEEEFEVTLTVRDTGKGISHDYLHNDLFTPFKQENPLAPGSGLGLSIVRQAVGFLGGSIEIESTPGVGTEVTIRTPLTPSSGTSDTSSSESIISSRQKYTWGKTVGLLGFGSSLQSQRDRALYSSLERLCQDWFGLEVINVSSLKGEHAPFDFYLAVQTELDSEDTEGRNLFGLGPHLANGSAYSPPIVVICQSPEEAHRLFVASQNQDETPVFEFISQPCGPRKLARALDICIKRQLDQQSRSSNSGQPTRWVEIPESSHLPMDIGPLDPPDERMKISKRPTAETMRSPQHSFSSHEDNSKITPRSSALPISSSDANGEDVSPGQSVLLVDDNDLNLQLLCAHTKKENYDFMTAQNGAEAVEIYKAHPGRFRLVIIDISMPVMDGFEASRQIRRLEKENRAKLAESEQRRLRPTIIAALTGLDSVNAQKEAFSSGIDTFLVKPVKRSDLKAILRRMQE